MQLSCQEPKMKMYISSLVMGRMEKKRKPCSAIAKILMSCQRWFGCKAKPQDHTAPVNKSPSQSDPVQLGTVWFSSGPQSSFSSLLITLSIPGTVLRGGAARSGSFVQSPSWAHECNPKAAARQGKVQFSWRSQSCLRKTHYNNNTGISRGETVRAEWKILS